MQYTSERRSKHSGGKTKIFENTYDLVPGKKHCRRQWRVKKSLCVCSRKILFRLRQSVVQSSCGISFVFAHIGRRYNIILLVGRRCEQLSGGGGNERAAIKRMHTRQSLLPQRAEGQYSLGGLHGGSRLRQFRYSGKVSRRRQCSHFVRRLHIERSLKFRMVR